MIDNDSVGDTMANNNNEDGDDSTPGDDIVPTRGTTLLVQLRNDPSLAYCKLVESVDPAQRSTIEEQTRSRILHHQAEFPLKLRNKIKVASTSSELSPGSFCEHLRNCWKELLLCQPLIVILSGVGERFTAWNGLDNEVDTEEEVEVAIRLFPSILEAQESDFFSVCGYDRMNPVFGVSTCIKTLPFVALLTELMIELCAWDWPSLKISKYYDAVLSPEVLVTNEALIDHRMHERNEEFFRQLDSISLSVMTRLRENGLFEEGYSDVYKAAVAALDQEPFRAGKRLRYLIDLNPSILKGERDPLIVKGRFLCPSGDERLPLLVQFSFGWLGNRTGDAYLEGSEDEDGADNEKEDNKRYSKDDVRTEAIEIFQMLTEAGMSNFPEDIGFLFHKHDAFDFDGVRTFPFKSACDVFGTDVVVNMVNQITSSTAAGRFERMDAMVIAAAASPRIVAGGLYFVCRRDPIAWIPLLQTEISSPQV